MEFEPKANTFVVQVKVFVSFVCIVVVHTKIESYNGIVAGHCLGDNYTWRQQVKYIQLSNLYSNMTIYHQTQTCNRWQIVQTYRHWPVRRASVYYFIPEKFVVHFMFIRFDTTDLIVWKNSGKREKCHPFIDIRVWSVGKRRREKNHHKCHALLSAVGTSIDQPKSHAELS